MKILIFEDDEKDLHNLKECISLFFEEKELNYEIDVCQDKEYLYNKIDYYDLLFLDISLGNENGIDIGLKLREKNSDCKIIITSNYPEYVFDGYRINAERYFLKPIRPNEFNIEMETILKHYLTNNLGIKDEKISKKKIYFKDILYIDCYDRKTRLHLLNGNIINSPYPLKYWIDLLKNQPFGQSNKAFLINFNYISSYNSKEIILINDAIIPISRHYKKTLEQTYIDNLHDLL